MYNDNNDDWELEYLLPQKKPASRFAKNTDTTLVEFEPKTTGSNVKKGSVIPKPDPNKTKYVPEPICSYTPENPFINKVDVWLWPSKFTFYERFRTDAEKNFDKNHCECEPVKFFSYMPQYIQLDMPQYNWYLFWRDNVRRKNYLKTDYSYILLYVYEVINLPELIPPAQGIDLLCEIWLAYRGEYPRLDRYMIEWICDYCLINKLHPPYDKFTAELFHEIYLQASFKEFYVKVNDNSDPYLAILMQTSSNYDWRKSKYVTDENRELFEKHITEAYQFTAKKHVNISNMTKTKLTRDAYSGSLCAYNVKRRIDIEFNTFARSAELRLIISDIIKYAENKVRAMIGIKGRLSTPSLTTEMVATLEEYFAQYRPEKKKPKVDEVDEQYAHLYEARSSVLSPENALEIEKQSWSVTNTLVEAFDEQSVTIEEPEQINEITEETTQGQDDSKTDIIAALKCIYYGDREGFTEIIKRNNLLDDSMIECINEFTYEIIGDIAVEQGEDWYVIIPDYLTDMEELINGQPEGS